MHTIVLCMELDMAADSVGVGIGDAILFDLLTITHTLWSKLIESQTILRNENASTTI